LVEIGLNNLFLSEERELKFERKRNGIEAKTEKKDRKRFDGT
jgi:hypothetical protein